MIRIDGGSGVKCGWFCRCLVASRRFVLEGLVGGRPAVGRLVGILDPLLEALVPLLEALGYRSWSHYFFSWAEIFVFVGPFC